jgi:hypothetical protein
MDNQVEVIQRFVVGSLFQFGQSAALVKMLEGLDSATLGMVKNVLSCVEVEYAYLPELVADSRWAHHVAQLILECRDVLPRTIPCAIMLYDHAQTN